MHGLGYYDKHQTNILIKTAVCHTRIGIVKQI